MPVVRLHDKKEIERFLRKNVDLHLYGLGDLGDFFWPDTTWYAWRCGTAVRAIALLYAGLATPALLALSEESAGMRALLKSIRHLLPPRFDAHLSPGLESVFAGGYKVGSHGDHQKMALRQNSAVSGYDCSEVVPLGERDLAEILEFYEKSYPNNWFDPRMLKSHPYFGIREAGKLVSAAGVHVFSPEYRVAALGNIATLPVSRGRGLAKRVTARLCQSLLDQVCHIGLNVKADNLSAISCYRRLGFEPVASFGEFTIEKM